MGASMRFRSSGWWFAVLGAAVTGAPAWGSEALPGVRMSVHFARGQPQAADALGLEEALRPRLRRGERLDLEIVEDQIEQGWRLQMNLHSGAQYEQRLICHCVGCDTAPALQERRTSCAQELLARYQSVHAPPREAPSGARALWPVGWAALGLGLGVLGFGGYTLKGYLGREAQPSFICTSAEPCGWTPSAWITPAAAGGALVIAGIVSLAIGGQARRSAVAEDTKP